MLTQQQIDAGLQYCEPCDRFGWHTYCGRCGRRYVGSHLTWRECPGCKARVTTDWCSLCGDLVASDFLKRMERGEVDWKAESRAAGEMVKRMIHRMPQLADYILDDYSPPDDRSLAEQLAEGFGQEINRG